MILVLDNYDSFTYNLVQYLRELAATVEVFRNDHIGVEDVAARKYDGIVISPGPGRPEDAGITVDMIRALGGRTPMLGVCLGHQAMALVHGGRIVRAPVLMHGKTSWIRHDGRGLFEAIPNPFEATRYHSLMVDPGTISRDLEVSARTDNGVIMGLRRRGNGRAPLEGVQFHPESILTRHGKKIVSNFLTLCAATRSAARR
jgi:anthranilate synthase/aminodeoxychorismate synthase-like glutamine amidotransferase